MTYWKPLSSFWNHKEKVNTFTKEKKGRIEMRKILFTKVQKLKDTVTYKD